MIVTDHLSFVSELLVSLFAASSNDAFALDERPRAAHRGLALATASSSRCRSLPVTSSNNCSHILTPCMPAYGLRGHVGGVQRACWLRSARPSRFCHSSDGLLAHTSPTELSYYRSDFSGKDAERLSSERTDRNHTQPVTREMTLPPDVSCAGVSIPRDLA